MTEAVPAVRLTHQQALDTLAFDDSADFTDAARGLIRSLDPCVVHAADGRTVWDNDAYRFFSGACPETVNPSLWRQGQLVSMQGLFEVVPGLYQVRGLDISNISFVEGDAGVIVIDPLVSVECAAQAYEMYAAERGRRPVTAVIYTHSHVDHFGGVKGVTSQEAVDAGECVVIAPADFMRHTASEMVSAGPAMSRRAAYMYGAALPKGPGGQVGAGLGMTNSTGTVTLIAPTLEIRRTGERHVVDGVEIVFQLTPDTEAPAEMLFAIPALRALCTAENATHTLHNLLTIRGAQVRDAHAWAGYLTETIDLFADDVDVVFASHHWPIWDRDRVRAFLEGQRDVYAYLHDQTLRLLNKGLTALEIAEEISLPPALDAQWHTRGYYGSISHDVKAVYQRYMGWYDGNPAHLWQHPPADAARRYVEAMGGLEAVLDRAERALEEGDLRWAATLLDHALFAEPGSPAARVLQARALTQLGYGAENGTWRSSFLTGAQELTDGNIGTPLSSASPDLLAALSTEQLLDSVAFRLDGPRAWDQQSRIAIDLPGEEGVRLLELRHGVLVHHLVPDDGVTVDLRLGLVRDDLLRLATGASSADVVSEDSVIEGDLAFLDRLLGLLDAPDPDFAVVLP